jgi:hypothetical protein
MKERLTMRTLVMLGVVAAVVSCANSYSTTYKGTGPASQALQFGKAAQARFEELSAKPQGTDTDAISKVRVYIDSVPAELAVDGNTISIRQDANAELLGEVGIIATLKAPSDEEAIPVLQRATFAAGADLAYCPHEGLGHRCYLVRTAQHSPKTEAGSTSL